MVQNLFFFLIQNTSDKDGSFVAICYICLLESSLSCIYVWISYIQLGYRIYLKVSQPSFQNDNDGNKKSGLFFPIFPG